MIQSFARRHVVPRGVLPSICKRALQTQPFEAGYDQEELREAREWHTTFTEAKLPRGETTFSRSSGPGGQHVNKTESKATTSWSISELSRCLPKILHQTLRQSKYYVKRSDSILVQAQTQRSRAANSDENRGKLMEEIQRMYKELVPGVTSSETKKKHATIAKAFHDTRVKAKKHHSAKKASRKGPSE
ncbi:uncharacterized protein B0I36DRAFT_245203 [Microdochium trichocladiopsis]|uniref:Prokaryotic-type class I peptide chain release factors domain-containing protein n=1 Tax=Microdochium trichocladiopsis TaxID=1682393 RepID=A0A9P8Y3Q2_9PEZI|nr:uncharacterized protein B0I36DRAFT_245203 [Microdochium trichocladiopsis]KAH7029163.1 hypothetical protein B0I36DRAFT_245203 [Microdochium trichocladiopsis]